MQRLAAEYGRKALNNGPDFFGEEEVLLQLGAFLRDNGVPKDYAAQLVKSLTSSNPASIPVVLINGREVATAPLPAMDSSSEDGSGTEEDEDKEKGDEDKGPKAPTTPKAKAGETAAEPPTDTTALRALAAELPEDELEQAQASLREPLPPTDGFVVSITKRGLHRKLHAVKACWMKPGVHYKEWHWHGDLMPGSADFDSVCLRCLPSGERAPQEPDELSTERSGSSSSSSGEEEQAPKRAKKGPESGSD